MGVLRTIFNQQGRTVDQLDDADRYMLNASAIAEVTPSRVDRQTVAELERVTAGLEGLEAQVSPRALLGAVVTFYAWPAADVGRRRRPGWRPCWAR